MIAALSLGFLGSLHCLGMCGPLALALPLGNKNTAERLFSILIYNSGRIFTYAILGFIFGSLGLGMKLAGFQQSLSIVLGVAILISVFSNKLSRFGNPITQRVSRFTATYYNGFFRSGKNNHLAIAGMLNGLLPCGLVYSALAAATVTSGAISGAIFMASFGAATFPMMAGISITGARSSQHTLLKFKRVIPYFLLIMGAWFIVRGMNLGIPYLSPDLSTIQSTAACHSPQ